ncbi:MAG: hypothetical protein CMJ38_00350 [Phycisphaerae bacterium]|nr:hypothetical protein [Phycisphaerae bacterium]
MMIDKFKSIMYKHDDLRKNCINLLPSENMLSPMAKNALLSDMGQRYFFKENYEIDSSIKYSYHGTKHIGELIDYGEQIARELFEVDYASLYPISGHMAVVSALSSIPNKDGTILTYDPMYGGYPGLDKNKMPKYFGFNIESIPVEKDIPEKINLNKLNKLMDCLNPTAIILSSAHTIFPYPLEEIKKICRNDCLLIYDASHPLGLIAGKKFQNPLKEGADIVVGGTQKSFPGPQGGIILTNDYSNQLRNIEHFVTVDNPHFHRIASLIVSLIEMKHFGIDYADQVVRNTKMLGSSMMKLGFPVKYKDFGYSESHMFKLNLFEEYNIFSRTLEDINIIIDTSGRVGTNEMTRLGMKEDEMVEIAKFIERGYFHRENKKNLRKEIIDFKHSFKTEKFCF